jgi:hypothetical protein
MRTVTACMFVTALATASASCGDVVRQGRAPVFLGIDSLLGARGGTSTGTFGNPLLSDVLTLVRSPAPCTADSPCATVFNDVGSATLSVVPKNTVGTVAPTSNSDVILSRYRVVYRRADGRNTPGVDVPHPFDGALTATVPAGGRLTVGFELVRHVAKQEPPLVQLIDNPQIITTLAEVTFFGSDRVGNAISATGTIQIDFGNFGDF